MGAHVGAQLQPRTVQDHSQMGPRHTEFVDDLVTLEPFEVARLDSAPLKPPELPQPEPTP